MNELMNKIGLNKSLKNETLSLYDSNKDKIKTLCDNCNTKGFNILAKENDLMRLAVCLSYADKYTKRQYDKLGISNGIFIATMKDISVWCENNENHGLKNYAWIQNHLKCELFRIGRLQYQFFVCNNPKYNYEYLPFDKGENTVFIHIPQGEKLDYSKCIDSIKQAKEFFEKHFADFDYKFFICESWLLYEDNWAFMKPSCNILQFQSLFDIVMSTRDDKQAIERIFGKRHLIKKFYPENTSLQSSAKHFMLDGNRLGIGLGIINKDEI